MLVVLAWMKKTKFRIKYYLKVNSLLDVKEIEKKMAKGEYDTSGSKKEEEDEALPPQEDQRAMAQEDDEDLRSTGAPVGMWTRGHVHTKFWQPP